MLPHLVAQGKDQTNAPKDYDETLDLPARDSWKEKLQEHSNGHVSISAPPGIATRAPTSFTAFSVRFAKDHPAFAEREPVGHGGIDSSKLATCLYTH